MLVSLRSQLYSIEYQNPVCKSLEFLSVWGLWAPKRDLFCLPNLAHKASTYEREEEKENLNWLSFIHAKIH